MPSSTSQPTLGLSHHATLFLVGLLLLALSTLQACTRSDFAAPADLSAIEQALDKAGLHVCAAADLTWEATPGFMHGKHYTLEVDCTKADPNAPGASFTAVRFDSLADRDAAQRNFETSHRRPIGLGNAWTLGPYLLMVDGSQQQGVIAQLHEAMQSLGAQ